MRRSLAAALLRSARGKSSSNGNSSSEGAAASLRRSIRSIGSGASSPPLAATTISSARGGAASCSSQHTAAKSSSSVSSSFFFCSRGIHTSSAARDSSPPRDYYDVLGVPRGAPEADVKRAFYRLAKQHHPDATAASGGDQAEAARRFQEVNKAYDCLRDPQKRAVYDQVGVEAFEGGVGSGGGGGGAGGAGGAAGGFGGGGGPFGGFGGGGGGFGGGGQQQQPDVEDIFAAFFGGLGGTRGGGPNPFAAAGTRSPDIHVSVRLPFEAAARGGRRTLNLATGGGGGGGGASRSVEIDVPAGIDTGAVLRVSGQGAPLPPSAPRGAVRGNLLVEVEVEPSATFRRPWSAQGRPEDVEVSAEVDFWDAALGGGVTVPTALDGQRELALRPGTQPGDRLRMKGYGLPKLSSHRSSSSSSSQQQRGDQYVRVGVRVPRRLSARAARLLRELAEEVKGGGGSSGGKEEKAKAA